MIVAFVRHGRTAWNDSGRMQGRADVPLSDRGRAQVCGWQLPDAIAGAPIVTSPLQRARETAAIIAGTANIAIDDALIEMDWGAWEGRTIAALAAEGGAAYAANSARGLDFLPPGGESPRGVQRRIIAWLHGVARSRHDVVAVTHQGVIRALLAHVSGWDMTGKPPVRLADDVAHLVEIDASGALRATWNLPLVEGPIGRRGPLAGAAPRR